MNRKQKLRYLLAIYLVVALIAVILAVFAFNQNSEIWQALFLNLSTELLGVVLVFLFVNVVFLVSEWDLSEQVEVLIQKFSDPSARDFFKPTPSPADIQKYIQKAKSIDMCGVTLTTTINRTFSELRQRLFDGANVRIIIIAPTPEALREAALRSESGRVEHYQNRLDATLTELEYLYRNWLNYQETQEHKAGTLAVGLLPYTPSFGLFRFQFVDGTRLIVVEMYPHHTGYDDPPYFILTPEKDAGWYEYFSVQFDEMWKRTTSWTPRTL